MKTKLSLKRHLLLESQLSSAGFLKEIVEIVKEKPETAGTLGSILLDIFKDFSENYLLIYDPRRYKEDKKKIKKLENFVETSLKQVQGLDGSPFSIKGIKPIYFSLVKYLKESSDVDFETCILHADFFCKSVYPSLRKDLKQKIGNLDFDQVLDYLGYYTQMKKGFEQEIPEEDVPDVIELYEDSNVKVVYPTSCDSFNSYLRSIKSDDVGWCTKIAKTWAKYDNTQWVCIATTKNRFPDNVISLKIMKGSNSVNYDKTCDALNKHMGQKRVFKAIGKTSIDNINKVSSTLPGSYCTNLTILHSNLKKVYDLNRHEEYGSLISSAWPFIVNCIENQEQEEDEVDDYDDLTYVYDNFVKNTSTQLEDREFMLNMFSELLPQLVYENGRDNRLNNYFENFIYEVLEEKTSYEQDVVDQLVKDVYDIILKKASKPNSSVKYAYCLVFMDCFFKLVEEKDMLTLSRSVLSKDNVHEFILFLSYLKKKLGSSIASGKNFNLQEFSRRVLQSKVFYYFYRFNQNNILSPSESLENKEAGELLEILMLKDKNLTMKVISNLNIELAEQIANKGLEEFDKNSFVDIDTIVKNADFNKISQFICKFFLRKGNARPDKELDILSSKLYSISKEDLFYIFDNWMNDEILCKNILSASISLKAYKLSLFRADSKKFRSINKYKEYAAAVISYFVDELNDFDIEENIEYISEFFKTFSIANVDNVIDQKVKELSEAMFERLSNLNIINCINRLSFNSYNLLIKGVSKTSLTYMLISELNKLVRSNSNKEFKLLYFEKLFENARSYSGIHQEELDIYNSFFDSEDINNFIRKLATIRNNDLILSSIIKIFKIFGGTNNDKLKDCNTRTLTLLFVISITKTNLQLRKDLVDAKFSVFRGESSSYALSTMFKYIKKDIRELMNIKDFSDIVYYMIFYMKNENNIDFRESFERIIEAINYHKIPLDKERVINKLSSEMNLNSIFNSDMSSLIKSSKKVLFNLINISSSGQVNNIDNNEMDLMLKLVDSKNPSLSRYSRYIENIVLYLPEDQQDTLFPEEDEDLSSNESILRSYISSILT